MEFLLDTHVFLWLVMKPAQVPGHVLAILKENTNRLFLSSISVWEIEQKIHGGKLNLSRELSSVIEEMYRIYDIDPLGFDQESAFMLSKLPLLHRDPFDRMIICQCVSHGMTLVTGDRHIHQYPVKIIW